MADRYFPNNFPDSTSETLDSDSSSDSLVKLLSLPYLTLTEKFRSAGLDIKNTVVSETWQRSGRRVRDYTLYTGALGTAYLMLKSYQVTKSREELNGCCEIVKACDLASRGSGQVTFLCGRAGVCGLGAVAAKLSGDEQLVNHYLSQFKEIKLSRDVPNELLYGKAGFLWTCSFLNKNIGDGTIPSFYTGPVVTELIKEGRLLSDKEECPLMYEWHGKKYWGAAHGLAGIMHVLMDFKLKPDEAEDVNSTLQYMIHKRFPSGNYPSSEGTEHDRLVHWCHGAPGLALTLVKAAEVFGDKEYLNAAIEAGEVVWSRGLLKRVGICHGVSGNAYVFLSLYRLTGEMEFLYRAQAYACFLLDRADDLILEGSMHGGDRPYSLFEGVAGMAHLLLDMSEPSQARFPAYEL